MEFKTRFTDLLDYEHLSARKLAKLLNIDHNSIYLYLQGSFPNITNAVKLANYFKCSLNYLFGLEGSSNTKYFKSDYDTSKFFERYVKLLEEKNISHYRVSKDLKFGNAGFKKWQAGAEPKLETLVKLANYFDTSIDYLIGRANKR